MRYKKNLSLAIDFDGSIVDNAYPKIGNMKPYAKQVIHKLRDRGVKIYLWTPRKGDLLTEATNFLGKNEVHLDLLSDMDIAKSGNKMVDAYIDYAAYPNKEEVNWEDVAGYFDIDLDEE